MHSDANETKKTGKYESYWEGIASATHKDVGFGTFKRTKREGRMREVACSAGWWVYIKERSGMPPRHHSITVGEGHVVKRRQVWREPRTAIYNTEPLSISGLLVINRERPIINRDLITFRPFSLRPCSILGRGVLKGERSKHSTAADCVGSECN